MYATKDTRVGKNKRKYPGRVLYDCAAYKVGMKCTATPIQVREYFLQCRPLKERRPMSPFLFVAIAIYKW
jgi:hypothetical protein